MVTAFQEVTEKAEEVMEGKHKKEDAITTNIERVTSNIPSGVFLATGVACIGVSAALALSGKTRYANFVGMWVPTVLILGLYNKLVKQTEADS